MSCLCPVWSNYNGVHVCTMSFCPVYPVLSFLVLSHSFLVLSCFSFVLFLSCLAYVLFFFIDNNSISCSVLVLFYSCLVLVLVVIIIILWQFKLWRSKTWWEQDKTKTGQNKIEMRQDKKGQDRQDKKTWYRYEHYYYYCLKQDKDKAKPKI